MNNGGTFSQNFTKQTLLNDTHYQIYFTKDYVQQFSNFVDACNQIINLKKSRYADDKIKEDAEDIYNSFYQGYENFYNTASHRLQTKLTVMKNSYDNRQLPTYTTATEALSELLRRQDFSAEVSLMTNDQLKSYLDENTSELFNLPYVDQQAILKELHRRRIKFADEVLEEKRQNRYKDDPNYQRFQNIMSSAWSISANGKNTQLAYFTENEDGSYQMTFVFINLINKLQSMQLEEAEDTVEPLMMGLAGLRSISNQIHVDDPAIGNMMANVVYDDFKQTAGQYKVADNDPRLNRNGSHWNWSVFYDFLVERFGNDPRITQNPIYADPSNPNYNIDKKYHVLLSIYNEQKTLHQYKPVKVVTVPNGKNPESLDDDEINKLFGKFD